jgi:sulfur-oxidizing protein SoxY
MRRRGFLAWIAAFFAAPAAAQQQPFQPPQDIRPLVAAITGGVAPERTGVEVELPQIAENGNSVPIHIRVASPMTPEDHVKAIYIFAERNPRPRVATFHLGPDSGRAEISARVRLAGTQTVTVLAELSGKRFLTGPVNVLVTSGACLDEGSL